MGRTAVALTALFDLVVLLLLPAAVVVESVTDSSDGNFYSRDSSIDWDLSNNDIRETIPYQLPPNLTYL
ncbi:hypothetical protein B296_00016208 [Ensete ventricosum]|uniref:Malectin-like domain-containing protein n=1 Tax=Ensete ventricosum TaxID=4639 RepID=A0A427B3V0_ENSVE|nr:hypothetical protein B296_00016208 [Ensete ventricosum]